MVLKREIGLWELTLSGIGVILGAGIYALVGKAAGIAGANIWVSFAVGGVIAILTGLSYAELSNRYPKAGAEYVYAENAFGKRIAFAIGLALVLVGFSSAATVALGFSGYLAALTGLPAWAGIAFILSLSAIIIAQGAKISTRVAALISVIEVMGLLAIIALGAPFLLKGFSIPSVSEIPLVLNATALVFFAYIGFEELVRLSEETKNAKFAMPKALLLAILLSTLLYVLVSASAIGTLGAESLAESKAPLADVAKQSMGLNAFLLLAIIALFSTGNTVLMMVLANSRLLYGMAEEKGIPAWFSRTRNHQPINALVVCILFSAILALSTDIAFVAHVTDGLLFLVFGAINASLVRIRWKEKNAFNGFRVPFNWKNVPIPSVLGALSSLAMLAFVETSALLLGIGLLAAGWMLFQHSARRKNSGN